MFNSSREEDFHVKNISFNTILQLCENELKCQPKLEDQRYSRKFLLKTGNFCFLYFRQVILLLVIMI